VSSATERVGRYQLLEPIGVGPSGSVSRAKVFGVAGFERQFAVKRFHHELTATPPMATALSAAARGYGSLEHPRIARMSEFGVAQGTTFTAVEFVAGLDALRLIAEAKMQGQALAAGGALALVSQAARAVGYAHGRGLTHLGLAPTNVIVTAEGDIKITDFGILAASLPQRPTDAVRLAHRIQYLAPEQLANEATSAATDVFALGVLAYELVTGQRTFRGDTPAQIAQSVMAGPPSEPPLPRPIVRVLQRCLARSPFERFPDARALADALDAALRVAPVPGTRKDIGAQVTQTLERIAAMNEGELSGMLALDIGTGPIPRGPEAPPVPALGRESEGALDLSTLEFVRPDAPVPGPTPLVGPSTMPPQPGATVPEMQKPFTTVPGLAPPPIPVPQGIATPPPGSLPPALGTSTLLGIQNAKSPPAIPLGKLALDKAKKASVPSIPPARPTPVPPPPPPRAERPSALMRAIDEADVIPPSSIGTALPPEPEYDAQKMTEEMSPLLVDKYSEALTKPTSEMAPLVEQAWQEHGLDEQETEVRAPAQPPPFTRNTPLPQPPPPMAAHSMTASTRPVAARLRAPYILAGALGVAVLGLGGWWAYSEFIAPDPQATTKVVTPAATDAAAATPDAAVAAAAVDAGGKAVDAAVAVAPAVDAPMAGSQAIDVAAPPDAETPKPTPSDQLVITSTPSRARVFLDGADVGATPLKLPGTPDRHTIAVLLPGHELYVAQVDGQGAFAIPLKEVTPMGGPAGIKVTRCKDKDRYYVFVDGKPTGMTCPTERIEVELGEHVVEVYDVVSDSRKKYDVDVKDTRLSVRVKIE
jgi:serine/threonine protein kinase